MQNRSNTYGHPLGRGYTLLGVLAVLSCGGSTVGVRQPGDAGINDASTDVTALSPDTGPDAGPDGGICEIAASAYNETCSTDDDCVNGQGSVSVDFGDYCTSFCSCPVYAINRADLARFVADVSRTPLGSGAISPPVCSCIPAAAPCCRQGMCTEECVDFGGADASDAANVPDIPDGSFLCAERGGLVDADAPDVGTTRVCSPVQSCLMFNGVWTCCAILGGVASCDL